MDTGRKRKKTFQYFPRLPGKDQAKKKKITVRVFETDLMWCEWLSVGLLNQDLKGVESGGMLVLMYSVEEATSEPLPASDDQAVPVKIIDLKALDVQEN